MPERTYAVDRPYADARAISTTELLGRVMFLVAIALGFLAVGSYVVRLATGIVVSIVNIVLSPLNPFASR
jgi:hypothetical protein